MRIVILDGFTTNPGDLGWQRLEKLGDLTVYERTSSNEVLDRCKEADIVFTNKTPLDSSVLRQLSKLRFIGVLATGYNVADVEVAAELGITVCNVPSYSTMSVAQNVFALILEITNSVSHYDHEVKSGCWSRCEDFSFTNTKLVELAGKQMGIIGFGAIGSQVAKIAAAFGMTVVAHTSRPAEDILPVQKLSLRELMSTSDVVSLHCPLTEKTHHIINSESLSWMKPDSILINTGRGPLVDEEALALALIDEKIRAAGVDVLSEEPPRSYNPLLKLSNCFITPHISWATMEARKRLIDISVQNLEAFLSGKPQNVVS